ncbi:ABC transporter substrate-binding protein [Martelella alba]|uniref:ABC transporter substrate-binding protein n=1 Tax=Martelella alba TaxID=2590451 RepID=A0A506U1F6_9HYPH|nr:ABC transporter substrate-binding protein [Martelella alba]TPW27338.1 ABC transporter substrate-binding protein [Martelella alba]
MVTTSRRDFLKTGSAGVAAAAAFAVLGPLGEARAQSESGVLRMAWSGSAQILDPASQNLLDEFQFSRLVYETLTELGSDMVPKPLLAKTWTVSDDGLTWTFTLADDAKFHSGKPFTADDVEFTFSRLLDPENPVNGSSFYDAVKSVQAVDDHTVAFELKYPYADFLTALALNYGSILPAGATKESLANAPDGTGPYQMTEFVPGTRLVYKGNKDYRTPEAVGLDEIRQETIAQANAQISSLTSGHVDLINQVSPQFVPQLDGRKGLALEKSSGAGFHSVYINTSDERFAKPQVREAMRLMMDRPALAQIAYAGLATPTADNVILTSNPFFDADVKPPAVDVEKAKALMAEAGYPSGFSANIYTTTERFGLQKMAVAYAAMLKPIGIDLKIVTWTNGDLGTQAYRKKELVTFYWGVQAGADASVAPFYESNGSYNGGASEPPYFSDPELDELIHQGKVELDTNKRKAIYDKIQEIIATRGYVLVPYEVPLVVALSEKVQNFHAFPRGFHDFKYVTIA